MKSAVYGCATARSISLKSGLFAKRFVDSSIGACLLLLTGCGFRQSSDLSDAPHATRTEQQDAKREPTVVANLQVENKAPSKTAAQSFVGNSVLDYDVDHPAITIALPSALHEISDITVLTDSEIGCVQDEQGIVFIYDWKARRISDEIRFASHGDYEGLALVDSQVYVLRSDGVLFELSSLKRHPSVRKFELHLPFGETEGLCHDAKHNRLLIAPKSRDRSESGKDTRSIFAFR